MMARPRPDALRWQKGRVPCSILALASLPLIKPSLKGSLAFSGGLAGKEILDADVLVQLGPVDAAAVSDQPPMVSLVGCPVGKSRIPGNRYGDRTTIGEVDGQGVVVDVHTCCRWDLCFSR